MYKSNSICNMNNEQLTTHETDNTDLIDSSFVHLLTERMLYDDDIREELIKNGFTQLHPAYTGFTFDTRPPGLTKEQSELWDDEQKIKMKNNLDNLSPYSKQRIQNENTEYERTLNYLKPEIISSFDILRENRYGLNDIFKKAINKEPLNQSDIIANMKKYNINVLEYPNREDTFYWNDNHGEAKYSNGKWNVKFNKVALSDSTNIEILHEYIAIESYDYYMRHKHSFKDNLSALPQSVLMMATGKSPEESFARGGYNTRKIMSIRILENMFSIISKEELDSKLLNNFKQAVKG